MQKVLWEEIRADAFTKEFAVKDSTVILSTENIRLQLEIFQKYHTDKEKFYASYNYYLQHDDMMKGILDSMIAEQARIREMQRAQELKKLKEKNEQNT